MEKITLNDILQLSEEQIKRTKIRFMVPNDFYNFDPKKNADDPEIQERINMHDLVYNRRTQIMFKKDVIAIGFIPLENDRWLMSGIVKIIKDNGYNVPASAVYLSKKYNFRLVIKYHKSGQQGVLLATKLISTLEVIEIWNPEKGINDKTFPGYKNVTIDYSNLKQKLKISDEWENALRLRKGVYVISDKKTGRLYVGSAYGKDGILGRWQTYINSGYDKNENENGKYPNKQLHQLVLKYGMNYIKENFQYSILETFTDDVSDEYIIERENWWKEALLTRVFGYNDN